MLVTDYSRLHLICDYTPIWNNFAIHPESTNNTYLHRLHETKTSM